MLLQKGFQPTAIHTVSRLRQQHTRIAEVSTYEQMTSKRLVPFGAAVRRRQLRHLKLNPSPSVTEKLMKFSFPVAGLPEGLKIWWGQSLKPWESFGYKD